MRVRAKSIDRVGEFVAFQYTQLPQLGIEKGQLVQRMGPPTPMVVIAFADQFAIGPITDLEPVWEDVPLDIVKDIAEKEAEAIESPIAALELPESARVTATPQAEGAVEAVDTQPEGETASADSGTGEEAPQEEGS
jgi:hypothetical protein